MKQFTAVEDEANEFKRIWSDNAFQDMAAFANHQGGVVWIGVNDAGQVVGGKFPDSEIQTIANRTADLLKITPSMEIREIEGKKVLCISVERSEVLITYKGVHYVRVGSTSQRMTEGQLRTRVLQTSNQSWDALPSPWGVDAVSKELVGEFLALANAIGRLPVKSSSDVRSVLRNLNLLHGDRLTNAAVLLFTPHPQQLFFEAQIQIARIGSQGEIRNPQVITGSLWEQLDHALQHLQSLLDVEFQIEATEGTLRGIQRQEKWTYPLPAIREALLNALTHRDYTIFSPVHIRVYEEHLNFSSPGKLPNEITIEDLYSREHLSVRRNPLIAGVFYRAGLIERWGTGTTRILDLFAENSLPQPKFEETSASVRTTFSQDIFAPDALKARGLSDRQIKAVLYTKENERITNSEYRELTELSDEAALQDINTLIEKNIFVRVGRGRGTHYVLAENKF